MNASDSQLSRPTVDQGIPDLPNKILTCQIWSNLEEDCELNLVY